MAKESERLSQLTPLNKIDPTEFDVTISALLIGIGAEKYIDIFKKRNIGQSTITELTDEDLIKLGIDEYEIRRKLIEEVKNLPIYVDSNNEMANNTSNLGPIEIADILEDSSQFLYRIYLSILANTLAVKKTKNIQDCLVFRDKYSSDVALTTLSEMTNILNSMDIALHTQLKVLTKEPNNINSKKIFVGTAGTIVVSILTYFFVRSLKDLK